MKSQARETTGVEYQGGARGNAIFTSYIRAFTEPFQEFMKLTAEGRPGPAGALGTGVSIGVDGYSAQTKKDESVLSDASRLNVPQNYVTAGLEQLGSYRYNEPLQQDIYTERNAPSILDAHRNNPYTQPLNAF